MFLNRAFDRYVLEDANLETELQSASKLIKDYRDCYPALNEDILECLLQTNATIRDHIPSNMLQGR